MIQYLETLSRRLVYTRPETESGKCSSVDLRQTIGIPSNVHYQHPLVFCVDWKVMRLKFTNEPSNFVPAVTTCRLTPVIQQYVAVIIQKIQCTQLQHPFLWPKGDLVLRYP